MGLPTWQQQLFTLSLPLLQCRLGTILNMFFSLGSIFGSIAL
jgi:hypothetical protein